MLCPICPHFWQVKLSLSNTCFLHNEYFSEPRIFIWKVVAPPFHAEAFLPIENTFQHLREQNLTNPKESRHFLIKKYFPHPLQTCFIFLNSCDFLKQPFEQNILFLLFLNENFKPHCLQIPSTVAYLNLLSQSLEQNLPFLFAIKLLLLINSL